MTPKVTAPTLPLSEVFGPVWQGEGPHAGRRCWFVRLGHCNLACDWCDTPYTWDRSRYDVDAECPPTDPRVILHSLVQGGQPDMVVLSGGEPLIHQQTAALKRLLAGCGDYRPDWHVETNGTIAPAAWLQGMVAHFTVSPKVSTSDPAKRRIRHGALEDFARLARVGRASWKVVCSTAQHVDDAARLFDTYDVPPHARWVMPEGTTAEDVLDHARVIADAAQRHQCNLTLRQHTLMYGQERAR